MATNQNYSQQHLVQNDEFKSSSSNTSPQQTLAPNKDYFIVKNPLVLLICCGKYQKHKDLPGVDKDFGILKKLFQSFYGWTVEWIVDGSKQEIGAFMEHHRSVVGNRNNNHQCKLSTKTNPLSSSLSLSLSLSVSILLLCPCPFGRLLFGRPLVVMAPFPFGRALFRPSLFRCCGPLLLSVLGPYDQ